MPIGKGVASNVAKSELLYNEFIVYKTSQVKLRYLVRVTFKYK